MGYHSKIDLYFIGVPCYKRIEIWMFVENITFTNNSIVLIYLFLHSLY